MCLVGTGQLRGSSFGKVQEPACVRIRRRSIRVPVDERFKREFPDSFVHAISAVVPRPGIVEQPLCLEAGYHVGYLAFRERVGCLTTCMDCGVGSESSCKDGEPAKEQLFCIAQ